MNMSIQEKLLDWGKELRESSPSISQSGQPLSQPSRTNQGLSIWYYENPFSGYNTWIQSEQAMKSYFGRQTPSLKASTEGWREGLQSGFPGIGKAWKGHNRERSKHGMSDLHYGSNWFHGKYADAGTENFSILMTGMFSVQEGGKYSFAAVGDDFIVVYIDGLKVCNAQWSDFAFGDCYLGKGTHRIAIAYHEMTGGQGFALQWKRAGEPTYIPIPQTALFHNP